MRADHVVIRGSTLICLHCAAERRLELPQEIRQVVETTKPFLEAHRACPKPAVARA